MLQQQKGKGNKFGDEEVEATDTSEIQDQLEEYFRELLSGVEQEEEQVERKGCGCW